MDHSASFGGDVNFEYLILGAGPAGLQIGHHLSRAGHSYLILEAGETPGTFLKTFPRHRTLASRNKPFPGTDDPELRLRFDDLSLLDEDGDGALCFAQYSRRYFPSADDLVRYLCDYAGHYGLNVRCGARILRVERSPSGFRLTDARGNVFSCRRLIVATGTSKPFVPRIPGIDQAESYADVSVDPEDFAGQRVLVIGEGSSAQETADNLLPAAALVHALDREVERIERREGELAVALCHADGKAEERVYDRVIVCSGFRFDDSIFASGCRPALAPGGRLPAYTPEWESINVAGLYFAGVLTQEDGPGSAFIQGFRYSARALFRLLEAKHHRRGWPSREVEPTPEGLVEATLARINRASALGRQPGFLYDVIVVDAEWNGARYCEELPLGYLQRSPWGEESHYYTISLEAGAAEEDAALRLSGLLHPVVRRWSGAHLVSEKHLPESASGEWASPEAHVAPLRYFFMEQLLESVDLEAAHYEALRTGAGAQALLRIV